jgi:hypothetical protein
VPVLSRTTHAPPAKPSTALHARLSALPATALRGEVLPERVPTAALLILREGKPGEPGEPQHASGNCPPVNPLPPAPALTVSAAGR